jgi:hypothetical protein
MAYPLSGWKWVLNEHSLIYTGSYPILSIYRNFSINILLLSITSGLLVFANEAVLTFLKEALAYCFFVMAL